MTPVTAYIALGSNLGDPQHQLRRAVAELAELPDSRLLAVSPWYRSAAVGPGDQPDYLNGVAALETTLPPKALLDALHCLEDAHGRVRTRHWGPRTLDLDLLLYGAQRIDEPDLHVPHPRLKTRNFVVFPLADIAADLSLPDGTTVRELLANTPAEGIVRLSAGD